MTREHASEERLQALARPDKWYLAAGDGPIWAPVFPLHLDRPGFWDEGHLFHFPVGPLFTVALVDGGRARVLRAVERIWRPDRLTVGWAQPDGDGRVLLVEERCVLPGARFVSSWRAPQGWDAAGLAGTWLVAYTQVPESDTTWQGGSADRGLAWRRTLQHRGLVTEADFALTVGTVGDSGPGGVRRCALRSQGQSTPRWGLTPFVEAWDETGLPEAPEAPGLQERGWIHLAVGVPAAALASDALAVCALRVHGGEPVDFSRPASPETAERDPVAESTAGWVRALDAYPRFRCSDPRLERYFDYRIYGLHLNRLDPVPGGYPHPAVAEGIEYFRWPISYSAQCHMMECRWSADPAVARGSLLNFLAAQRVDGFLPGRLEVGERTREPGPDFYHAGWGDAVLAVDDLHPDPGFLARAYEGLARYAGWLEGERDPEGSGMITVVNHYETGQEYMSRYLAVDASSDTTDWDPRLALKGVDVTVYAHRLYRALAVLAERLGRADEAEGWEARSRRSGQALMNEMWSPDTGLFSDVDAATGARTGVRAAVCFYPLLTDLLEPAQVDRLLELLDDPAAFATPWPVPSSAVDDPFFDAQGLWKGKRNNCPWNGRVWPMTNSHLVEGLLRQWRAGRRQVGPMAARLLARFVHMMFDDGDPARPNCFEHYNPLTAHPSRFRGIDDYQHSWVLDLLVRGAAGLDVTPGALVVDPLPMGLDRVSLERCRVRGHEVAVHLEGGTLEVTVDGATHRGSPGTPLAVPW